MFRTLALLMILPLGAVACGDGPEAPVADLQMSLEVIEANGSDPLTVHVDVYNAGNIRTVSHGGCWVIDLAIADADGNARNYMNPCLLALLDCIEVEVKLYPREHYERDFPILGVVYEVREEVVNGYPSVYCDEVPMEAGEYTASASLAYRTDNMPSDEPSLAATASTTFNWNP